MISYLNPEYCLLPKVINNGESGTKPSIMVRYELRSNTTPVATTDSAAGANTSRLGWETRLQRWIHRNALAPLQYLILFKNPI
ncbi:hypothetical protein [Nostoc sp. 'Peltigera membranacea cyanobiont' 232]|uniref:hypothetical protein n=1 Tax=Nostoc sp. 'Peltigera membranacea cyanobiont' 232 TaxID=2014531 RepID=UPI001675B7BF|nr:hypothetical protein [Nostoc sp. 'Peltigera membranacea cyanobiont' 232]